MFAGLPGISGAFTGSDVMRVSPVFTPFFAFNNPGGLANFFNITPPPLPGAQAGDFLRRAGLPDLVLPPSRARMRAVLRAVVAAV